MIQVMENGKTRKYYEKGDFITLVGSNEVFEVESIDLVNKEIITTTGMKFKLTPDIKPTHETMQRAKVHNNTIKRERGFEKISKQQFDKDFAGLDVKYEDIKLPKRGTALSAGYDCFTLMEITLLPNQTIKVPTGIRAYMKPNEVLKAYPRSGHGFKYFLRLANTVGIVDADFIFSDNEGHIHIKLRNEGDIPITIPKGEGMCQLIFENYLLVDGDNFEGERRNGGWGSTNKKQEGDK